MYLSSHTWVADVQDGKADYRLRLCFKIDKSVNLKSMYSLINKLSVYVFLSFLSLLFHLFILSSVLSVPVFVVLLLIS